MIGSPNGFAGPTPADGYPLRVETNVVDEGFRPVATAIADADFQGYVAHEFVPTRDPLTSLREAVELCYV